MLVQDYPASASPRSPPPACPTAPTTRAWPRPTSAASARPVNEVVVVVQPCSGPPQAPSGLTFNRTGNVVGAGLERPGRAARGRPATRWWSGARPAPATSSSTPPAVPRPRWWRLRRPGLTTCGSSPRTRAVAAEPRMRSWSRSRNLAALAGGRRPAGHQRAGARSAVPSAALHRDGCRAGCPAARRGSAARRTRQVRGQRRRAGPAAGSPGRSRGAVPAQPVSGPRASPWPASASKRACAATPRGWVTSRANPTARSP